MDWKEEIAVAMDTVVLHHFLTHLHSCALARRDFPNASSPKTNQTPIWHDLAKLSTQWL